METFFLPKTKVNISAVDSELFTEEAIKFLIELHENFNERRKVLLQKREARQSQFDLGKKPGFLKKTKHIRNSNWAVQPLPEVLLDRRVEITGPVERKMIINALNSGASVFMADFEDSCSPTWENIIQGQQNLMDAVQRTISLQQNGKQYQLNKKTALLMVRPRGLHLEDKNVVINEEQISGALLDFGLYFFNNIEALLEQGISAYFYLPKLEHYKEAAWWNDVFEYAQEYFGLPKGTIKATVLIETITASFQLDEIIYALKDHIAGLNCGRWDYIFSYIKKLKKHKDFITPNRDLITMTSPFMQAYSLRVIQRCHKRGILAIGGMAAQIPIKNDEEANKIALEKVQKDKEREVKNGHDGTWVAHPALVPVALEVFNTNMLTKNHLHIKRSELTFKRKDLLAIPQGIITEEGVRKNINVGILYVESWLMGVGAAALYHLMEDAATAEISRVQLWHWKQNQVSVNKRILNEDFIHELFQEELEKIKEYVGNDRFVNGKFNQASELFQQMIFSDELDEFLTLKAYQYL